jgi:AAA ATPase domain
MGGRVASPTLVGRVEELETLEAARRRAADGEPAVVLVGGEAGVGKTRLAAELTARCLVDGTRVLAGGCVPVGGNGLPFAPIMEALRPLPEELGVDAVRELGGPSWRELARLLPTLGEPEAGPAGQVAQARLFELLLGLLARLSQQTPVTLVVEDLHWADQSTRDLLAFLVRNLRRERILAVLTYRSDEPRTDRLGPWLAELDRVGPVRRLELVRLDRAETVAQLIGILGAVPAADLVDELLAVQRATRSSPRSCWRRSRPAPVPCRRRFGTCFAVESNYYPTRPSRCWRWLRWRAGGCPTGCWQPWPTSTTESWPRPSGSWSPTSCW